MGDLRRMYVRISTLCARDGDAWQIPQRPGPATNVPRCERTVFFFPPPFALRPELPTCPGVNEARRV